MKREPFSWREGAPREMTCARCLETRDSRKLDRLLWCEECRATSTRRAARIGWWGGAFIAGVLAAYIVRVVQPSDRILSLWAATLLAALWLGGRVVRELVYGTMRFRNRPVAEAGPSGAGSDVPPRRDEHETD